MLPNVYNRGRVRLIATTALIGAAILAALTLGGTPPADAQAGSCPGSLIESRSLNVGGKKVGELNVYYDASTGRNCARMNHAGDTWGKKLQTRAWIGICSETKPGSGTCHYDPATDDVDKGNYAYYAGPVKTKTSAAGRCIAASGYLWIGGTRYAVGTKPWVGHCG